MSRLFIELGSVPWKETPAKFADQNYRTNAQRECRTYIEAIRNYLGQEPTGAELDTKLFDGDRGAFYEVVVYYDEGNKKAEAYARKCERQAPHTWQEGGVKPPPQLENAARVR